MACGSGDAQTIAVTDSGLVYSWGDGDYGKLGRGGSDGSKVPKLVDKLQVCYMVLLVVFSQLNKHTVYEINILGASVLLNENLM